MKLSIIVPCFNEEGFIYRFLKDVDSLDFSGFEVELFIIDGNSTDSTVNVIQSFIPQHFTLQLLVNEKRFVSDGLNIALDRIAGDVVLRMDVHASYPSNYVQVLVNKLLSQNDVMNVGCVVNTLPSNESKDAYVIAEVISSPIGVGNSSFRTGVDFDRYVDTVPFGCFKTEIFSIVGKFDTELIRNQDDEFNARIRKFGYKVLLTPDVSVDYYPRSSVKKIREMFYQYGLFKPLVNSKIGTVTTLRQLAPASVVILFLLTTIISMLTKQELVFFIVPFFYFLVSLFFSCTKLKNVFLSPSVLWVLLNVHFSYGVGYIIGTYSVLFSDNKRFKVNSSR